jgi:alkylation response protein AidB-like acyl-CoA dehydrogenase
MPLQKFGTEEQKREFLPRLCSGESIAVASMSEPGAGSDMGAISTSAVKTASGYRLSGTKTMGTNGPAADVAFIFATTAPEKSLQERISGFIIDADTPGYAVTKRFETLGHRTAPIGLIELENVEVPENRLLGGREGLGVAAFGVAMNTERIMLFAAHCGAMQRILETTIRHARKRKQYGQPISKFQAVSHKIADMKVRLEAAKLLVFKAASRLDIARDVALDAAIAKLFTSEALVQSAQDCLQIHGGYGYMTDFSPERELRDAIGTTLYSGTSEIQRNIIAGWLGL